MKITNALNNYVKKYGYSQTIQLLEHRIFQETNPIMKTFFTNCLTRMGGLDPKHKYGYKNVRVK